MNQNIAISLPRAAAASIGHAAALGTKAAWTRFMKAPMASSGSIVLAVGSVMVLSNALFGQAHVHPSPFFFDASPRSTVSQPVAEPAVTPAPLTPSVQTSRETAPVVQTQPVVQPQPVVTQQISTQPPAQTTDSVAGTVTNEKLARAQSILQSMGLFSGEVDGFYGPKTAEAIRAFELRVGLTPKGALDGAVIDRILRASSVDAARPQAANVQASNAEVNIVQATPVPVTGASEGGQAALQALIGDVEEPVQVVAQTPVADAAEPALIEASASTDALASIEPIPPVNVGNDTVVASTAPVDVTSKDYIEKVQKGLASLAFLQGSIDGVAGESTAKAIRNFEVFYNYEVTGAITPELLDMLRGAGASIN